MEGFKKLMLGMEFESLYFAIRHAFLLTSKVNTIDEQNLHTVFISSALPPKK